MSVYRSTNALNKLFGLTQTQDALLSKSPLKPSQHLFTALGQDVTPIGYSTRLQFSDYHLMTKQPPKFDNLETNLSEKLKKINTIICELTENKKEKHANLPVIITHNFTKAEIDISAKSPLITAVLEEAFSGEIGQHYRRLAWDTYQLLKSVTNKASSIYLYNGDHTTIIALSNDTSLQLHIEGKT